MTDQQPLFEMSRPYQGKVGKAFVIGFLASRYGSEHVGDATMQDDGEPCSRCGQACGAWVVELLNYVHGGGVWCAHCLQHLRWAPKPANVGKRKQLSPSVRWDVLQAAGFQCGYCGRQQADLGEGEFLQVDHIVPVANGGTNEPENLCVACSTCNEGKGAKEVSLASTAAPL